jgi:Zn-finger nucleic acid-binding protein
VSCPTCDHTMQYIAGISSGNKSYLCPRCGTLKAKWVDATEDSDVPKLVERTKELVNATLSGDELDDAWSLGILESVGIKRDEVL